MRNPLVRSLGLGAYSRSELVDRAHELFDHSNRLAQDPAYLNAYLNGGVDPDPMEGYEPGDPWYDYASIDRYLAEHK